VVFLYKKLGDPNAILTLGAHLAHKGYFLLFCLTKLAKSEPYSASSRAVSMSLDRPITKLMRKTNEISANGKQSMTQNRRKESEKN
jgi:hypothetical protein